MFTLGPVRLVDRSTTREINSGKAENLLTSLLVNNGHSLSTDQLIQEMWGTRPPRLPRAGLHVYISQLRKTLADLDSASSIDTVPQGYRLDLGPDRFDYTDAVDSARSARSALVAGDHLTASRHSEFGLRAWRGAPRTADTGPILEGFEAAVQELRLELREINMSARVLIGGDQALINSLHAFVAEYPLRESFYSHLMLALYERGRQAEALLVYQRACMLLDEELGVLPGPELRRTHAAILRTNVDKRSLVMNGNDGRRLIA
ncbi:MAG: AfsR/SARP family transcriptional regulator [Tomitella sp.]|nr:AfsR/SARP family transcriptional regulator [Tomitella sp.]